MKQRPWILILLPFLCVALIGLGLYTIYPPLAPLGVGLILYCELYMYYRGARKK